MTIPIEADRDKALERLMARHHNSGDALIEVLHGAQQLYGYLPPALLKKVARTLKLPPSKVLGVATFYHLFRFQPAREHTAVVCSGTACYVAGSTELSAVLRKYCAGHAGEWTLEEGRCVGSCGMAPTVICDGRPLSRLTPEGLAVHLRQFDDTRDT